MNKSSEDEILAELKQIKKLLALSLVQSESSESERIKTLNRYGFQPKEISDLLQVNPSTVGTTLFRARHKKAEIKKS